MPGEHLRRLDEVWVTNPIYFAATRAARLANDDFHAIAVEVRRNCRKLYGWSIGRHVIMPDHVHFFAFDGQGKRTLRDVVGKWREWTAKTRRHRLGFTTPLSKSED